MLYTRLLLPLSLLLLLGCRQTADTPPAAPTDHLVLEEPETEPAAPEAADTTAPAHTSPKVDTTGLAPEPDTPIKLLLEGSYHKNEVWGGAEKMEWLGLFHESSGYVLRPTELMISTVRDPVTDGDSLLS